jgi:hypothetical protein
VIQRALSLLADIHHAFVDPLPDSDDGSSHSKAQREDPALEDAKRRRALHALLDLISVEGIYPSLSQGVGIPLEQRVISVLPKGVVAKQPKTAAALRPQDENVLRHILNVLAVILSDDQPGIQSVVLGRILTDIICGAAELAFNSARLSQDDRDKCDRLLETVIDKYGLPMNHNRACYAKLSAAHQPQRCCLPSRHFFKQALQYGSNHESLHSCHTSPYAKMECSKP